MLVVEDDRVINDQLAERLRAEGYDVAQAFDGLAAVHEAHAGEPDVVVLDVMLPGIDGHEVCRRIQALRPVPVLMLTARDDEADILVGPRGRRRRLPHQAVPDARGRGPGGGPAPSRRAGRRAGRGHGARPAGGAAA